MSDTYLPLPPPIAESDLSDIVEGILRVGRCLSVEEIVDRAYDDGWDLDDDPHSDVLNELDDPDRPYFPLADGRWVHLPSLLSGQVLTHRVTAEEIEHDVLAVVPDLSLFHLLTEFPGFEQLAGGGDVGFAYDNSPIEDAGREIPAGVLAELGSLVLASGTLKPRGLVSGDLVGLRCGTDGIEVVDIDAAGVPAAMLRDHLLGMLDQDRPSEVDDVIAGLLAAVPDGFVQPLPPISQLLDSWGVWQHDDLLAAPGFDFDSWLATRKAEWQEERYGLTTQESAAVRTILALLRVGSDLISAAGTGDADDGLASPPSEVLIERADLPVGVLEAVTAELAEPAVAYAVLDQWQVEMSWAGTLAAVCASLEALTPRRGRVGLHWLWAKALEDLD
ncbi:MAG: hypothetical protein L0H26_13375, partial [Microlunatus sp.]|nr:hypothetical protein [Microlunatus sp.]